MNLIKLSRCILGEYHKQNCAGGLHWNNENKICDWPNDAKCSSGIAEKPTTSTTTSDPWWTPSSTTTTTVRPTTSWTPSSTTEMSSNTEKSTTPSM
uniref:Chitin-binding type-2 domain-containing protein n=1 Tax=Rhodnius prolixus TaxID=13249 RepID=T1IG30_RHOPR